MALIPMAVVISVTAEPLISFVYSEKFSPGASALSILIAGTSFVTLAIMLTNIISASGKPKVPLYCYLATVPVVIALHLLFIPKFGIIGAAISTSTAYLVLCVVLSVYVFFKFNVLVRPPFLLKAIFTSLILYIALKKINVQGISVIYLYVLVSGMYFTAMIFLREIDINDIRSMFASSLKREKKL
jgi:stage V sporulation protein B